MAGAARAAVEAANAALATFAGAAPPRYCAAQKAIGEMLIAEGWKGGPTRLGNSGSGSGGMGTALGLAVGGLALGTAAFFLMPVDARAIMAGAGALAALIGLGLAAWVWPLISAGQAMVRSAKGGPNLDCFDATERELICQEAWSQVARRRWPDQQVLAMAFDPVQFVLVEFGQAIPPVFDDFGYVQLWPTPEVIALAEAPLEPLAYPEPPLQSEVSKSDATEPSIAETSWLPQTSMPLPSGWQPYQPGVEPGHRPAPTDGIDPQR
ncbi:hypothetical protein [Propionicimonas sp.]|uniref:hypothetical protein n=1 Tax=Propionicimonas sp. TaxID=1955623 RepID=UPI0017E72F3D|nr:hypothetical protein [Propionicimonas sp.]MBU3977401.1 hypothetical protein [Actinomycetota bacterium]MBA3021325.1 hypothetical protein [Propionicimonas sp.]MBU3985911.1 hypothetical protein [Actinomycetota bacterium]MBU4008696.1 hypothetical protein [Actinomycetota bacterium]MBU4066154.1 hypothetical protein [Actinomycetota bacterium]